MNLNNKFPEKYFDQWTVFGDEKLKAERLKLKAFCVIYFLLFAFRF